MPKYIDAEVLKEKIKYSMLIKMGYLNDCADMGREIEESDKKQILDSIDLHRAFIELIDEQPTIDHIADTSISWPHENGKDLIYRQDAINAKQEFRNPNVMRSTEARTAYDRAYANGWNDCNSAWIDIINALPSVQSNITENLYPYKCYITDKDELQHEVIHIDDIRRVVGWEI